MSVSKVQFDGNDLINLQSDTVTADKLQYGYTAHNASGERITGTHVDPVVPSTQEKTVNPSTNQQEVTPDSGKLLSKVTVNAIQTETQTATPSESVQHITPTSGKYLTDVQVDAVSSTYVGSGVTKKSATTYTPGTTDQTIAANQYLNGVQTIKGDADLVASNIKKDVTIFNVTGTYEGSGGSGGSEVRKATGTSNFSQASSDHYLTINLGFAPSYVQIKFPAYQYDERYNYDVEGFFEEDGDEISHTASDGWVTKAIRTSSGFKVICYGSGSYDTSDDISYIATGGANAETVTVTPSSSEQYVLPSADNKGIVGVKVNTDANLIPQNIVSGKTIFGVAGTYEGIEHTVDDNIAYQKTVSSPVESGHSNNAIINKIGGRSIVLNQMCEPNSMTISGLVITDNGDGSCNIQGTKDSSGSFTFTNRPTIHRDGRKYLVRINKDVGFKFGMSGYDSNSGTEIIWSNNTGTDWTSGGVFLSITNGETVDIRGLKGEIIDLKIALGSISDTIMTPEQAYALGIPRGYISKREPTLTHAAVTTINSYDIVALSQSLPAYGIDINGLHNEIDFAGKKYVQRIGSIELSSLIWESESSGSYWVCDSGVSGILKDTVNLLTDIATGISLDDLQASMSNRISQYSASGLYTPKQTYPESPAGILYYELAEPVETDISDTLDTVIIGTLAIPAAVQALTGYGMGIGDVYNEVDFINKKYTQRIGVVDMGDISWGKTTASPSGQVFFYGDISSGLVQVDAPAMLANYAKIVNPLSYNYLNDGEFKVYTGEGGTVMRIAVCDDLYVDSTREEFRAAKSGEKIYFQLKTPVETDISDLIPTTILPVQNNGVLIFENNAMLPMPSEVMYIGNEGNIVSYGGEVV